MAWYYGTYSCGHQGRVDIIGPTKNRQWIADRKFEGMCPECYEKYRQEQREKSNLEAAEKAKEMELPVLQGTEKQVAWANTIRQKFIDASTEGDAEILNHVLTTETDASWYIDNRFDRPETVLHRLKRQLQKVEPDITAEAEAKAEATIRPEDSTIQEAAEIIVKDDEVSAVYKRNNEFRAIVKSLGYKWNGNVWARKIGEITGAASDRAAELGNKLLNAGFPIIIMDPDIRQKAIDAAYEPECKRWIYRRCAGQYNGWLSIEWDGQDDDLYRAARKLPQSRYSSGAVVVKPEHYPEIQDFADMFGFKFTKAALETIEAYKDSITKGSIVKPGAKEELPEKNGLKDVLNSSSDILDDLKED